MIELNAAGGAVYRVRGKSVQVLLIYRNGVWDLPKGKQEQGETAEACARREVAEETGIPLPDIEDFLTTTYHEYDRDGNHYGKTTYWYRMRTGAANDFTPQGEEGIEAVAWAPIDEARDKVAFDNLREVLDALQAQINS